MRAREYFNKYQPKIMTLDPAISKQAGIDLMRDMATETFDTIRAKNAESDDAVYAIINKQNDKWNNIVGMFVKKFGMSPLRQDYFRKLLMMQLRPETRVQQEERQ
jgi:hypothetical protein